MRSANDIKFSIIRSNGKREDEALKIIENMDAEFTHIYDALHNLVGSSKCMLRPSR